MDTDTIENQGTTDQEPQDPKPTDDGLESPKPEETPEELEAAQKAAAQDSINKTINKKHRQMMEAREETEETKRQLHDAQAKLDYQTQQQVPEIPELPNSYDPEYNLKMQQRDKAIVDRTAYDQAAVSQQQQAYQTQQQELQEQQTAAMARVSKFQNRVTKLGLKPEEILVAEQTVGSYIQSQDVKNYLLDSDDGALMVSYLAANPIELEKIGSMQPMQAAIHLQNVVGPEAIKLAPTQTKTPDPSTLLGGRARAQEASPMLQGATFE